MCSRRSALGCDERVAFRNQACFGFFIGGYPSGARQSAGGRSIRSSEVVRCVLQ